MKPDMEEIDVDKAFSRCRSSLDALDIYILFTSAFISTALAGFGIMFSPVYLVFSPLAAFASYMYLEWRLGR